MADITIIVSPAQRAGKRQHDRFDAHLHDTGELICSATRQPLLDGARVLLNRGYDPRDVICKVWQHAPEIVSMRATVGVAAQYDVIGDKFVRRKSTAGPMAGAPLETQSPPAPSPPVAQRRTLGPRIALPRR